MQKLVKEVDIKTRSLRREAEEAVEEAEVKDQEDPRLRLSLTNLPKLEVEDLHQFLRRMQILTNSSIKERWTETSSSLELEMPLSLVLIHPEVTTTSTEREEEEPLKAVSSTQAWLDQLDMPLVMELSCRKEVSKRCFKWSKRKKTQD
jgi:hypothetical protein